MREPKRIFHGNAGTPWGAVVGILRMLFCFHKWQWRESFYDADIEATVAVMTCAKCPALEHRYHRWQGW